MLCLGYPLPAFSPTGFPHLTPPRLRPCPCLLSSEAVHGHTAREEPQPPQPPTLPRPAALSGAPSCLLPQGREEAWGWPTAGGKATYQQRWPAGRKDTHDPQELDQCLCGDSPPLLAGAGRGRFGPTTRHQGLDGGQVAGHRHHEGEEPQDGEGGGEEEAAGELAVAGADEAPGAGPLQRVLAQAGDGQEGEGEDGQPDAEQHRLRHPRLHVAGVPVGRPDGQRPLHGHGAGDEERAEAEEGHAEAEEGAEVARGVDGVPGAVGQVDGDDDGAGQQLPQQVGEGQGADAQQEGSLPPALLGPVAAGDQQHGQGIAHDAGDHHGQRERHRDGAAALRRPPRPVVPLPHGAGLGAVGLVVALRPAAHPDGLRRRRRGAELPAHGGAERWGEARRGAAGSRYKEGGRGTALPALRGTGRRRGAARHSPAALSQPRSWGTLPCLRTGSLRGTGRGAAGRSPQRDGGGGRWPSRSVSSAAPGRHRGRRRPPTPSVPLEAEPLPSREVTGAAAARGIPAALRGGCGGLPRPLRGRRLLSFSPF